MKIDLDINIAQKDPPIYRALRSCKAIVDGVGLGELSLSTKGNTVRANGDGTLTESPLSIASLINKNPTGTASTTGVMMGLGGAITLSCSGKLIVSAHGEILSSAVTDGARFQISYGTGAVPSNGAALTGTQVGTMSGFVNSTGDVPVGFFSKVVAISGLSLNIPYWIDIALQAVTGGTATIRKVDLFAWEL